MKITLFVIFTNLSILFFYKTNHRLRPSSVKLLTRQRDKKHSNVEILEFDGVGIPFIVAKIYKFFVRIFTQPLEKKSIMCYNLRCGSVLFFSLRERSSI